MPDELEIKQNQISTPVFIYVVCTLGVLGPLPNFFLRFTELAYMVGQWYLYFLLISPFLIWFSVAGVWRMKKWGVLAYSSIIVVTEIILFKYNVMWSYTSLIIPLIVTTTIWFYFKKMT
ncbi:MAG: hypothetical protein KAY50_07005 [Chitinophagaceae bacterium]|nr:hypothetical protein [Chitinophagaceae bacterium]